MLKVELKTLLDRLNSYCLDNLQAAAAKCASEGKYEVLPEHLLLRFLEAPAGDLTYILQYFGISPAHWTKLLQEMTAVEKPGNTGRPVMSDRLIALLQEAWLITSLELGEKHIRSGAVLLALLKSPTVPHSDGLSEMLAGVGVETLAGNFFDIVHASPESTKEEGEAGGDVLEKYCIDFSQRARDGLIDPIFGRENELRRIVDILSRRRKNNPIIMGDAGVGKTALVEGLALRISESDVPEVLKNVTLLGLDLGLLEAGAGVKGEFEERLKSVIKAVSTAESPIILFIDEAHSLIGAGGRRGGDAADLLKPALARGELRTIAATTWSEYKRYFERDAALSRRFQPIKLEEPDVPTTIRILRGLKGRYEEAHGVSIRDDAVCAAAELSARYIVGRRLPDKAIDLLDTSAARVKLDLTGKPRRLEISERSMQDVKREIEALCRDRRNGLDVDDEALERAWREMDRLRSETARLKERCTEERRHVEKLISLRRGLVEEVPNREQLDDIQGKMRAVLDDLDKLRNGDPLIRHEVCPDVAARVVSDWTGIPLGKVLRDEAETLLNLESILGKRVFGQYQALSALAQSIRSAKSGLKDPKLPLGVFLLAGPGGTGKTETAMALADVLFGDERSVVTLNMSEFQEKHTVSRLIGSPPGYAGYGEGGVLTEAVRRLPYSAVLLDEAEKAHIEVLNLFYQIFDKGMLADGEGRVVDFKNTLIIMTTSLGAERIEEQCREISWIVDPATKMKRVNEAVRPILAAHLSAGLLSRLTVVPFYPLDANSFEGIVKLKLDRLAQSLAAEQKIRLEYSQRAVAHTAELCSRSDSGGRSVDHIIRGSILPDLSMEILRNRGREELKGVTLDVNEAGGYVFRFDVKSPPTSFPEDSTNRAPERSGRLGRSGNRQEDSPDSETFAKKSFFSGV